MRGDAGAHGAGAEYGDFMDAFHVRLRGENGVLRTVEKS
jgi:hypothetical protein